MRAVAIEPCAGGLVIRQRGVEQDGIAFAAPAYVPRDAVFHFPTIEAARDFCWACGFTWSVKATP